MPLLEVRDLAVSFATADGIVRAVGGLSFSVERGQTLGIVGESGAGKSVATQTIVGLTQRARISGHAYFEGRDLLRMDGAKLRHVRGAEIGLISRIRSPASTPSTASGGRSSRQFVLTSRSPSALRSDAQSSSSGGSGSRSPTAGSTTIRTSSQAGCVSGR